MDPDSSVSALPTPAKHAGRPNSALGSTTVAKQQAQIANLKSQEAKQKKKSQEEEIHRKMHGPERRSSISGDV